MRRLYSDRITEAGRQAIDDLIHHIAEQPDQTIETQRGDSIEVSRFQWVPPFIYHVTSESERALGLPLLYLPESQQIKGHNADEIAIGLFRLGWMYRASSQPEARAAIFRRHHSIRGQIADEPIAHTMMEELYDLAVAYQRQDDIKGAQRAFLTALLTLCLLVLNEGYSPTDLLERLSDLFQSLGVPHNIWAWLIRRCDFITTDFVGLVSFLIDEGLFPSEARESDDFSKLDVDASTVTNAYEIVLMEEGDWKLSQGFSDEFPVSVAEGELSMRVERLLAEGSLRLRTTDDLSTVLLVFSSNSMGKRITVFGTENWSEEEDIMTETVGLITGEHVADSAMVLLCVDKPWGQPDESFELLQEAHSEKGIVVIAGDAKSILVGVQSASQIEGRYLFDEPIVMSTEDDWFSEFTFRIQPGTEK